MIGWLRESGYSVALRGEGGVSIKPPPPPELVPELKENKLKIIEELKAEAFSFLDQSSLTRQEAVLGRSVTCGACLHFKRRDHPIFGRHQHLGNCAKGEPEAVCGLWDDSERSCKSFNRA